MKKSWIAFLTMVLCIAVISPGWAAHKIGFLTAITGPASLLGEPQKNTAIMLQEWINAAGGIRGVPIEIVIEDSKSVEADAVLVTRKLIEKDNVLVVIGSTTTGESMAMVPICEQAKTPMISMAAGLSIVTPEDEMKRMEASKTPWLEVPKKQRYWIFKTAPTDASAVEKIYIYCQAKKIKRVGIITVTAGFGVEGRRQLKRLAPKYGIEIVADELYGPRDTDMTTQLTKIKASPAQAVINWSVGPPQVIVTKNWSDLGMRGKIPLIQSHGFGNKSNIKLAGGAAEGVITPLGRVLYAEKVDPKNPQKPVIMKYKTEYEKRFKADVSTFGGHAYDAIMMVADALKAVGPDKKGIRDYLETKIRNWPGTGGIYNMSPTDHTGFGADGFEMIEVVHGEWEFAE
ncbi:MAG TPA: ABC transporter substrate-binding protein [Thermodesulfobacteriota bacterium]|jgi:branched-chain amino acid transport system substrate-binding protein|nr:ABC transporter substrate-binding protein [Thermodesulfobacteriota bacterium]